MTSFGEGLRAELCAGYRQALNDYFDHVDNVARRRQWTTAQVEVGLMTWLGPEVADAWREWVRADD